MGTVFEVQGRAMTRVAGVLTVVAGLLACEARLLDVSGAPGEACGEQTCAAGQVCAAAVCVAPVEIHGRVIDASTQAAIAGARVHGQDSGGTTPGPVAISDEEGRFVLSVGVPRTDTGAPAGGVRITLSAFAAGYRPFPDGLRVALPIAVGDAELDEERGAYVVGDAANTTIGLIAAKDAGVTISGRVGGEAPAGTLVIAEGSTPVYGLADVDGTYTLFDVRPGKATVRGYRRGVSLVARAVDVKGEDLVDVDLAVDDEAQPGSIRGSVQLVDPGDGEATSVVLVPTSVFDEQLARGPVPLGLRAPDPGRAPDVTGAFTIEGVPAGTYRVLAGFENDGLVRDPDVAIGGTMVPQVKVGAGAAANAGSFKVTGALAVVGPGRDEPEVVSAAPSFTFASDASADHYLVRVFDELGMLVWEASAPRPAGNEDVVVEYAGPALKSGAYYQFRAVSVKDMDDKDALSTTEDLRGVFVVE